MPVTLDGSTPAFSTSVGGTNLSTSHYTGFSQTSASFTPPANSLVAVLVQADNTSQSFTSLGITVHDSLGNGYTLSPAYVPSSVTAGWGLAIFWHYYQSAPGTVTVTAVLDSAETDYYGSDLDICPLVFTGASSSQAGAAYYGGTRTVSGEVADLTFTPAATGSRLIFGMNVQMSAGSGTTIYGTAQTAQWYTGFGYQATPSTSTNEIPLTASAFGAGAFGLVFLEILPASSGAVAAAGAAAGAGTAGTAAPAVASSTATPGVAGGGGDAATPSVPAAQPAVLAEDASSPAWVHGGGTSPAATTASFTPPAGSLLVAQAGLGHAAGTPAVTLTDSAGNSWTAGPSAGNGASWAGIWTLRAGPAPAARTVTARDTVAHNGNIALKVTVLTGAAESQAGAASVTATGTSVYPRGTVTTTAAGSLVYAAADVNALQGTFTPTANLDTTVNYQGGGQSVQAAGRSSAATVTPGAAIYGWTCVTSAAWSWAALEILPGTAPAGAPASPAAGCATASGTAPAASVTAVSAAAAVVVQAKQVTGTHSLTLDRPTTAHNTVFAVYAGSSGGSGLPAVTSITLGGSPPPPPGQYWYTADPAQAGTYSALQPSANGGPPAFPLSDAAAAALVIPLTERRPGNAGPNATPGPLNPADVTWGPWSTGRGGNFWSAYLAKVTGWFTGSTDEIISWGCHKWGLDEDRVRAEAVRETSWNQSLQGDAGLSQGLLQIRCSHSGDAVTANSAWGGYPWTHNSTPLAVDYFCAWIRACYDGAGTWLYSQSVGAMAAANGWDWVYWTIVGAWYSGAWDDSGGQGYSSRVQTELANRTWEGYGSVTTPPGGGGGTADQFTAQVSQAEGTQSCSISTAWMDADCTGGQTAVTVAGTSLVAADALLAVAEVSGLGPVPVLDRSGTGELGGGTTAWTSGPSGAEASGGQFVLGVTAHGPDFPADTLTGPPAPWTAFGAPFTWAGGSAVAGWQAPAAGGDYEYAGEAAVPDYFTALVAVFAPAASPASLPGDGAGTGDAPAPSLSLSSAFTPDMAGVAGEAPDAGLSASSAAQPGTAGAAGDAGGAQAVNPSGGLVAAGAADAAGEAPFEAGFCESADLIADTPAGAAGTAYAATALTITTPAAPETADGYGGADTPAVRTEITVTPDAAGSAGQAPVPALLALSSGQAITTPDAAGAAGDAPAAAVFAYAQPVYLGASGGAARSRPSPGGSQVSVTPPGGGQAVFLAHLGHVQDLKYSFVLPGGADKLTCVLKRHASLRSGILTAGWHVKVHRGGHAVWAGRLDQPQPGPDGWTITAVGDGQRGNDFTAIWSGTWPAGQPDDLVNQAIARGLNWVNPGVGQPSWLWTGQQPDTGSATVASVLTQMCSRGGGTWYADPQPDGRNILRLTRVPADPDRLLLVTVPVPRTLAPLVNRLIIRYQATPDSTSGSGAAATYGLVTVTNATDVTVHDVTESYLDLSSSGVMTAAAAQAAGNSILGLYRAAAYAGPFTATAGQLLTSSGVPVDPGAEQAGHVVKLVISDFGMGGETTPATPVTFCVGGYEWNDQNGVATLSPYQTQDGSLQGLVAAVTGGT